MKGSGHDSTAAFWSDNFGSALKRPAPVWRWAIPKASPAQKSGYSTDLKELRERFNADRGKVRLLMLLSPT